jgi:16S rRNA (cytosine1402-N4)-methyltransferase
VLLEEVVYGLGVRPGGTYIDCTVGTGGHAKVILEESSPNGVLIAIDRDDDALRIARISLQDFAGRVQFFRRRFSEVAGVMNEAGVQKPDGFLFDLGLSAIQVDVPERGFSYRLSGPLDMRMDRRQELTAADLVNELDAAELERTIRAYGEERWSRRVARSIVRERMKGRVKSTAELASIVRRSVGGQYTHKSVARVFQALRIRVNEELEELRAGLDQSISEIGARGRIVVISYHSLEDRIVKRKFIEESKGEGPRVRILTKRVVKADPEEIQVNKRARSARLRVAEAV